MTSSSWERKARQPVVGWNRTERFPAPTSGSPMTQPGAAKTFLDLSQEQGVAVADQVERQVAWVWVLGVLTTLGVVATVSEVTGTLVAGLFAALVPVIATGILASAFSWGAAMLRLSVATSYDTARTGLVAHHSWLRMRAGSDTAVAPSEPQA